MYSGDMPLVLNQYRRGSAYKDVIGRVYHFPARYRNRFAVVPVPFVYYEPREGGDQAYFGVGIISATAEDTEEPGHFYADISTYSPFPADVDYYGGPDGTAWEPAGTMRNSVRDVSPEWFEQLCIRAGTAIPPMPNGIAIGHVDRLQNELADLTAGPVSPPKLRRIQRVLESYERPSAVTNQVKRQRGSICQLCGLRGFRKRDGSEYCEVHHLFHLSADPPPECLRPEYVIVVCANCHRRLHYAAASLPLVAPGGWRLEIDGDAYVVQTGRE